MDFGKSAEEVRSRENRVIWMVTTRWINVIEISEEQDWEDRDELNFKLTLECV